MNITKMPHLFSIICERRLIIRRIAIHTVHQLRCIDRDKHQKYRVNQQIGHVEIFAIRIPFHL